MLYFSEEKKNMRITCSVDVINRLPGASVKKSGKALHTQLSIGKKPGSGSKDSPLFLMMCTAKDRNGTKFKVITNGFSHNSIIPIED